MQKLTFVFALLVMLLLTACAGAQPSQPTTSQSARPIVTVYSSPT